MVISERELKKYVLATLIINAGDVESATQLAEHAAHAFNHDEWLDDETHWIWDAALVAYLRHHRED